MSGRAGRWEHAVVLPAATSSRVTVKLRHREGRARSRGSVVDYRLDTRLNRRGSGYCSVRRSAHLAIRVRSSRGPRTSILDPRFPVLGPRCVSSTEWAAGWSCLDAVAPAVLLCSQLSLLALTGAGVASTRFSGMIDVGPDSRDDLNDYRVASGRRLGTGSACEEARSFW